LSVCSSPPGLLFRESGSSGSRLPLLYPDVLRCVGARRLLKGAGPKQRAIRTLLLQVQEEVVGSNGLRITNRCPGPSLCSFSSCARKRFEGQGRSSDAFAAKFGDLTTYFFPQRLFLPGDLKAFQSISSCLSFAWIRHSARSSTLTLHNGHRDR
jgi:hypothetical protein